MGDSLLVLRRRAGEAIVIGEGVEICIMEISPTRVKLGVLAPREVSVVRKETIAVAMDNRKAAELVSGNGTCCLEEIARAVGSASLQETRLVAEAGPKGFAGMADKK
jgi:carbon storage regulator